jgi:hypothetical protein
VGNTIASVASYTGPLVVAYILKEHNNDWPLIFSTVAAANVIAAVAFGTLSVATPVDVDVDVGVDAAVSKQKKQ